MDGAPDRLAGLTIEEFSNRLASAEPVPGGGSASAIVASFAASLLAMVANLSAGREKYAAFAATHARALEAAERGRARLLQLADDDAAAYARFSAALKLPRETDDQQRARAERLHVAAREASEVPLEVVRECAALLDQIDSLAGRSNLNAASDLEVAARLAAAAARGAAANVLINLPSVGDERFAGWATAEVDGLLEAAERDMLAVSRVVAAGHLREPEVA
ncbi:MAG TPA: cyclodeaminase/cyclohydrolase family protein [Candidatus Limnocylindrales bacterium]